MPPVYPQASQKRQFPVKFSDLMNNKRIDVLVTRPSLVNQYWILS